MCNILNVKPSQREKHLEQLSEKKRAGAGRGTNLLHAFFFLLAFETCFVLGVA